MVTRRASGDGSGSAGVEVDDRVGEVVGDVPGADDEGVDEGDAGRSRADVHPAVTSTPAIAATAAGRRTSQNRPRSAMTPSCHRPAHLPRRWVDADGAGCDTRCMRSRIALAAGSALVLASMVAAPAHAEFYNIDDPADAPESLTDVYGIEANHGSENLRVKVYFNELMRSSAAGISVFIDTDRDVKGPEYVLSSGLGDGTDYVLTEAEAWRGSDVRVRCDYAARPRWGKDVFRAVIDRDCFDRASSVRVSVKMGDQADGSQPVVDWAPKRHRWSLPIESGLGA